MGPEEGGEVEERGGKEASKICSCVGFKLEGTSPSAGSTAGVTVLACDGTIAAAGSSNGCVEWMEAGAVLGPGSK